MSKAAMFFSLSAGTLWGCMGLFTRTLSAEFGFTPPDTKSCPFGRPQ